MICFCLSCFACFLPFLPSLFVSFFFLSCFFFLSFLGALFFSLFLSCLLFFLSLLGHLLLHLRLLLLFLALLLLLVLLFIFFPFPVRLSVWVAVVRSVRRCRQNVFLKRFANLGSALRLQSHAVSARAFSQSLQLRAWEVVGQQRAFPDQGLRAEA